ncbi:MAG: pyridoxal-phosphate dependent enzyme [Chloroflexi bacterium]|nr:pyridoxal-phosphate dependent enzyme [Chloroflexota bacterium]
MIFNNADHDSPPVSTLFPPTTDPGAHTRLYHARHIGAYYGFSRLYLKLEGLNPSGTQKDRVAAQVIAEALTRGDPGVTVGTCGNFGVALARVCQAAQLPCHIFIPRQYTCERVPEMLDCGAAISYVCGTYEEAVIASQEYAQHSGFYDANPSGIGGAAALAAYREIAFEVLDDLGETPASLWVVVGNGTTLAGIHRGFKQRGTLPRLGAVGSLGNTALTASIPNGVYRDLAPDDIRESLLNEALVSWRSLHGDAGVRAIRESRGWCYEATDRELRTAARLLLTMEQIESQPSSAGALLGLQLMAQHGVDPHAAHVVVLTS